MSGAQPDPGSVELGCWTSSSMGQRGKVMAGLLGEDMGTGEEQQLRKSGIGSRGRDSQGWPLHAQNLEL